jgi:hypothetical protein
VKIHGTHKKTPAMAAGVYKTLPEVSDRIAMIEKREAGEACA